MLLEKFSDEQVNDWLLHFILNQHNNYSNDKVYASHTPKTGPVRM